MSNNTRVTLTTRVNAIEGEIAAMRAEQREFQSAVLAALGAPKVVAPVALEAPVVTGTVLSVVDTPKRVPLKVLNKTTRPAFVEAHAWAKELPAAERGTSTLVAMVEAGAPLAEGWALPSGTVKAKIAEAKARKEATPQVVAVVEAAKPARKVSERAPEPEYGTEAWIAWARPTDEGAPRRADGTAAPKREWAARIALAESGLFDRKQIDAAMAAQA